MLEKYDTCIEKLDTHDAVGVDYSDWPFRHFSGNFWWSKASWINSLTQTWNEVPTLDERHICEFWLGSGKDGSFFNLWSSGIHPMQRHLNRYESWKYRLEA
jgi:hypothetical protein